MRKLKESELKHLKTLAGITLGALALIGVATLAVVAPNIVGVIGRSSRFKRRYDKSDANRITPDRDFKKTFFYLKKSGYVELIPQGNEFIVKITRKGQRKIERLNFENLIIKKPGHWDGNWWFVLADIPSKPFRRRADYFREKLKELGFYLLQRTVWVYPFDPRQEVDFVSEFYNINRFVTVMKATELEEDDEQRLRYFFAKKRLI